MAVKTQAREAEDDVVEPAPTLAEGTAALLDATVADMVERQVQERLAAALAAAQPPVAPGLFLTDPASLPPVQAVPDAPSGRGFTVLLPERFAHYVEARAAAHGETVDTHLAGIVRSFWQGDVWRQMQTHTAPNGLGQPAGTARR
jgi:hypothetical protein